MLKTVNRKLLSSVKALYARAGNATILNFQNRNGRIPPYQARQLIEMLNKYES